MVSWRVPLILTGTLHFQASEDLGALGSGKSQDIEYVWQWYYTAPAMIPWLILALALVLPKINQQANSWQILIPIVIVYVFWQMMLWALGETLFPSSSAQQVEALILSLCIATTVMWLFVNVGSSQKGVTRFFRAIGILAVVSSLSVWCLQGLTDRNVILTYVITLTLLELSFALSALWARRFCAKTYKPLRFISVLLPCSAVVCILVTLISYGTLYALTNQLSGTGLTELLLMSLMGGTIMGIILYTINLPFLILGALSPFYRQRFQTYMDMKPNVQIQTLA